MHGCALKGDSVSNIQAAIKQLPSHGIEVNSSSNKLACTLPSEVKFSLDQFAYAFVVITKQVLRQSRLYESAPAYVTDQPRFVNGALAALTSLQPLELLDALKSVEVTSKREQCLSLMAHG